MKPVKTLLMATFCALVATGFARASDDYPSRPIRLIAPVPAGSALDQRARHLAQAIKQHLGWTVVVENKPGAGQSIAMAFVARAAPDGYTLVLVNNNITINPYLQADPGYDPFKSFAPITQTMQAPLVLVVGASSEAKSLKQLVALSNAKPEGLTYASSGLGSTPFITAELLKQASGMKALHVAFKGDSEWLPELMSSRVDFAFAGILAAGPLIKSGKLRPLAVTSKARSHALADVPSIAESGFPGYDYIVFSGILAPAGTPKSIIDKLNAEFRRIIQMPAFQEQTRATGPEPVGSLPEEFAALLRVHDKREGDIVKALGLKPE